MIVRVCAGGDCGLVVLGDGDPLGACGGAMSWRERCVLVDGEGLFFFFVGLRWDGMGLGFCSGWALGMGVRACIAVEDGVGWRWVG